MLPDTNVLNYFNTYLVYKVGLSGANRWWIPLILILVVIAAQTYIVINIFIRSLSVKIGQSISKQGVYRKGFFNKAINSLYRSLYLWIGNGGIQLVTWSLLLGSTIFGQAGLYNQGIQLAWAFVLCATVNTLQFIGYQKLQVPVKIFRRSQVLSVPLAVLTSILIPLANQALVYKQYTYIDVAISLAQVLIGLLLGLLWSYLCIQLPMNYTIRQYLDNQGQVFKLQGSSNDQGGIQPQMKKSKEVLNTKRQRQLLYVPISVMMGILLIASQIVFTLKRPAFQMFEYTTIPESYWTKDPTRSLNDIYTQAYRPYSEGEECGLQQPLRINGSSQNCSAVHDILNKTFGGDVNGNTIGLQPIEVADLEIDSYLTYSQTDVSNRVKDHNLSDTDVFHQSQYTTRTWLTSITPDLSLGLSLAPLKTGLVTGINLITRQYIYRPDATYTTFGSGYEIQSGEFDFSYDMFSSQNVDDFTLSYVGLAAPHNYGIRKQIDHLIHQGQNYMVNYDQDWVSTIFSGGTAGNGLLNRFIGGRVLNKTEYYQFVTSVYTVVSLPDIVCSYTNYDNGERASWSIDVDLYDDHDYDLKVQYGIDIYHYDKNNLNGSSYYSSTILPSQDKIGTIKGKDLIQANVTDLCVNPGGPTQHVYYWVATVTTLDENYTGFITFSPIARPMQRISLVNNPTMETSHKLTYQTDQCQGSLDILQDTDFQNGIHPQVSPNISQSLMTWAKTDLTNVTKYFNKMRDDCNATYQFNLKGQVGEQSNQMNSQALLALNVLISVLAALTMAASLVFVEAKIAFIEEGDQKYIQTLMLARKEYIMENPVLQEYYNSYVWAKGIDLFKDDHKQAGQQKV